MAEVVRTTRINLSDDVRENAIEHLNHCLANTLYAVLASKFAHWNVKGTGFYPAHKLFDEIYGFYSDSADMIAERITALGGNAEGMINEVISNSTITYQAVESDDVTNHMAAMADMLSQVGNYYREGINKTESDMATQDLFIELTRGADKFLYFLEADLRKS